MKKKTTKTTLLCIIGSLFVLRKLRTPKQKDEPAIMPARDRNMSGVGEAALDIQTMEPGQLALHLNRRFRSLEFFAVSSAFGRREVLVKAFDPHTRNFQSVGTIDLNRNLLVLRDTYLDKNTIAALKRLVSYTGVDVMGEYYAY